ncbi:Lysylphosphatidylglycerol synthase TM region [Reichenbachiella faecimaris]|uniref:Lysylphosphatidylglycerol synthase TM region n=1 Tax=Reichenbachiella faecimaris TaxID=692418 RepID=A0A1W2G6C3_REIFA|nr:lysylphosphatidylglycerol synthase domain-containing protein [Reichenbachiella faecimaris]SMD32163.1 Lysylphosphatidylglycerol synthase TM region [Reichenbachiella faecimaris]
MIRALVNYNSSWGRAIWLLWSWVLPAVILGVVIFKLVDGAESIDLIKSVHVKNMMGLILCLALLPLNIGFESWKWQYILKPIEEKSLWNCSKIILTGKSLNVISPFGIGDGFSRYVGLCKGSRNQIFSGLAVDRFSQMLPTLVFGVKSVLFLLGKGLEIPFGIIWTSSLMSGVLVASIVCGLFVFKSRIKNYLFLIGKLRSTSVLKILMISVGRYLIFVLQFYFIFWALGSVLPVKIILLGIAWIFLVKTIWPNMSVLGDLVKRGVSATLFFSFFTSDLSLVLMASFLVWVINIVLPAVTGLFFVSDLKKSF